MSAFHKVIVAMTVGSFAGLIVLAVLGHFLELHVPERHHERASFVAKVIAVGLLGMFVFSIFPLALHLFVVMQGKIGNADAGMVRFLREHERGVTFGLWGIFGAGLLIALPVMWTDLFGFQMPLPSSQGNIVANIGMTIAEVTTRSTFKVDPDNRGSVVGSNLIIQQGVFNFEVADTGMRFEDCRYCAFQPGPKGDPKIVHINVGISTRKMTRDKLAVERAGIIARLQAAGWSAGRNEDDYGRAQTITMYDGTRQGDGSYWAKDGTLLVLSEKRMDEAKPGEDPDTAGEFIHGIDLLPRNDEGYQKLKFGVK